MAKIHAIRSHAKGKADQAVKNNKAVIQDAHDFYKWVKKVEENS